MHAHNSRMKLKQLKTEVITRKERPRGEIPMTDVQMEAWT